MRVTANGVNLRNIGSPGQLIASTGHGGDPGGDGRFRRQLREQESSGIQINYVPREGGNRMSGSFFGTYVGPDFQNSNYSTSCAPRDSVSRIPSSASTTSTPGRRADRARPVLVLRRAARRERFWRGTSTT
jgi:hypothetical protein